MQFLLVILGILDEFSLTILGNLQIGDKVKVGTYWSKITYTVTSTKVIDPDHADDIFIKEGKDMIILMTCISNGSGGFDRYLVFCER